MSFFILCYKLLTFWNNKKITKRLNWAIHDLPFIKLVTFMIDDDDDDGNDLILGHQAYKKTLMFIYWHVVNLGIIIIYIA